MHDLTPLPHSRQLHTPSRATQLSKSQTSLLSVRKHEEKTQDTPNKTNQNLKKSTNSEVKPFGSNAQLTTTKLTGNASYADYENYFYI